MKNFEVLDKNEVIQFLLQDQPPNDDLGLLDWFDNYLQDPHYDEYGFEEVIEEPIDDQHDP